ncbi:MAG: alpha-amylase family glycosyl hydrolase, partial [Faecalibacterium sp.]
MNYPAIPREFFTGECFDAYRFLGAHPCAGPQREAGWLFRVWAPGASAVEVCGGFDGWGPGIPMTRDTSGVWSVFSADLAEGDLYKYRVHGKDGSVVLHSDPYAFAAELRPGTASRLTKLEFRFDDDAWMQTRDKCRNRPLNIYELHAGSWKHRPGSRSEDGSDGWYTYDELARELIPWLLEHHYTHVELLPLAEHPFDGSWGYQTTGYFAVTSRYGTPAQFAAFVNACHRMGIGVLMDFVPVHFAPNADGLARFDGTCLYEYDSDVGHSEWGTCNFNYYRHEVCSFLNSAAALWMDVYHCDGIRMDAVSRALYWQGDPNRGVNEGAVKFLRQLNHGLNKRWPTGIYTAEDSTNFLKVTAPTRYDGVGFDYKWDMGWMHDTLDYFATPFGERPEHYGKLTWSMHYFYNELYLLSFSHDEVVHGKKTIIDKLWGTYD